MNDATIINGNWTTGNTLHHNAVNGFYSVDGNEPFVPSRADGTGLSAIGLPITNKTGVTHNGFEGNIQQDPSAYKLLNSIIVHLSTGITYTIPWDGLSDGHPVYDNEVTVIFVGGLWSIGSEIHPDADGQYPPKTGWSDGSTIEYDSIWIGDDGHLKELSWDDILAFPNLTQDSLLKFSDKDGVCILEELIQYKQKTLSKMTYTEYLKSVAYIGAKCGIGPKVTLRDTNGDLLYDLDGELIFAMPE